MAPLPPHLNPALLSDEEDKELMLLISQGNESALRKLIEKHQKIVYGTIVKMLGDATEAQDIAQLVFVRIYRAAGSYQATAQFRTWMFTIVRNLVFNELRRRGRVHHVSLQSPVFSDQTDYENCMMDLPDTHTQSPSRQMLQKEMIEAIDRAILALPEQQRMAVILRRYDEFSYEEIAAIMQTSVPSTKSLLFRARETLRTALQAYLVENDIAA